MRNVSYADAAPTLSEAEYQRLSDRHQEQIVRDEVLFHSAFVFHSPKVDPGYAAFQVRVLVTLMCHSADIRRSYKTSCKEVADELRVEVEQIKMVVTDLIRNGYLVGLSDLRAASRYSCEGLRKKLQEYLIETYARKSWLHRFSQWLGLTLGLSNGYCFAFDYLEHLHVVIGETDWTYDTATGRWRLK